MTTCTDPAMGRLLAEYELGLLKSSEMEAFEVHALSCDRCFAELDRMTDVSAILRASLPAWETVREAAESPEPTPWYRRVGRWLWPADGPWLKPALSLAAVLLLAPLAWRGWNPTLSPHQESAIRQVQELVLTSLRGEAASPRVSPATDVDLILVFGFELGSPGRAIEVTLIGPLNDTLYQSHEFELDGSLQGKLNLKSGSRATGVHTLVLYDGGVPSPLQWDTLRFEVSSPPNQTQ